MYILQDTHHIQIMFQMLNGLILTAFHMWQVGNQALCHLEFSIGKTACQIQIFFMGMFELIEISLNQQVLSLVQQSMEQQLTLTMSTKMCTWATHLYKKFVYIVLLCGIYPIYSSLQHMILQKLSDFTDYTPNYSNPLSHITFQSGFRR